MRSPLALQLLLALLALAQAARALHWDARESQPPGEIWRRDKTIYERGNSYNQLQTHHHFYMAEGQSTGVIEGKNLLCQGYEGLYPPAWLRVTAGEDYYAPNMYISGKLDRVEIRRQYPYSNRLEVYVDRACILF